MSQKTNHTLPQQKLSNLERVYRASESILTCNELQILIFRLLISKVLLLLPFLKKRKSGSEQYLSKKDVPKKVE